MSQAYDISIPFSCPPAHPPVPVEKLDGWLTSACRSPLRGQPPKMRAAARDDVRGQHHRLHADARAQQPWPFWRKILKDDLFHATCSSVVDAESCGQRNHRDVEVPSARPAVSDGVVRRVKPMPKPDAASVEVRSRRHRKLVRAGTALPDRPCGHVKNVVGTATRTMDTSRPTNAGEPVATPALGPRRLMIVPKAQCKRIPVYGILNAIILLAVLIGHPPDPLCPLPNRISGFRMVRNLPAGHWPCGALAHGPCADMLHHSRDPAYAAAVFVAATAARWMG